MSQSGASSFDSSFSNYYSLSGPNHCYVNTTLPNELNGAEFNLQAAPVGPASLVSATSSCSPGESAVIPGAAASIYGYNQYCGPNSVNGNGYYLPDNNLGNDIACDQDQCQSAFVEQSASGELSILSIGEISPCMGQGCSCIMKHSNKNYSQRCKFFPF